MHRIDPDRLPTCYKFLKGICEDDDCVYSHVHVNPSAPICPMFLRGYCPDGQTCIFKHVWEKKEKKQKIDKNKQEKHRQGKREVEKEVSFLKNSVVAPVQAIAEKQTKEVDKDKSKIVDSSLGVKFSMESNDFLPSFLSRIKKKKRVTGV